MVIYALARETHAADLAPGEQTTIQHSFSYSDGFGREIQKKLKRNLDHSLRVAHKSVRAGSAMAGLSSTTRETRFASSSRSSLSHIVLSSTCARA